MDHSPDPMPGRTRGRVLLTGATGYVGGRLLRRLQERGVPLRCLARRPEHLRDRLGAEAEVARGDLLDPASLAPALAGIETAYYLVHSMGAAGGFEERDRDAARHFGAAARQAGVARIVYLGGLGDEEEALSVHLRSRHEVGRVLRDSGVPVIEFRASIVIGSGSLSFEMVRALVERLPVMVTPRWVKVPAQPIGIEDLLDYLVAALDVDPHGNPVYEIGGADVMSYEDLMREYARQRGLRRLLIPVPVLTPRLSSRWLGLVTPLYARVGRKLIESVRHPTVVHDPRARREFRFEPQGVREAIASALRNEDREFAETRWSDALSSAAPAPRSYGGVRFGRRLLDSRAVRVPVPPRTAFAPIRRIGGATGWYAYDFVWQLRGFLDLLVGGVGMRRRRNHPERLRVGDALDCWRVEALEADRRLRLAAEMKLPGRAWLEFEATPEAAGTCIRQTAIFDPVGLSGLLYWYGIYPLHALVFRGMLAGIAEAARREGARFDGTSRLSTLEASSPSLGGTAMAKLDDAARREIANALSRLLADSYTLYLKTHNYHWNVTGPMFTTLHTLFEQEYLELALAVDEIAERIRALGHRAPGSYTEFAKLARVKEEQESPDASEMLRRLAADQATVVATAREVLQAAEKVGDEGSVDLAVQRMRLHEKNAWMLRSHLE